MKIINNKILLVVLISTLIGGLSGAVGAIVARVYLMEEIFNLPLMGSDINLSGNINNAGLIIRDAKKIIIEQNDKVSETAANVKTGIVGIFNKIEISETSAANSKKSEPADFRIENYYQLDTELAQGFIITSDGWILSAYIPETYKNDIASSAKAAILDKYAVISSDNKIYPVIDIVLDSANKIAYWRIAANDLPVKRFAASSEIKGGQIVVASNWQGDIFLSSIASIVIGDDAQTKSSDNFSIKIELADLLGKDFGAGFLFNLNNEIVALLDADGKIESANNLLVGMNSLFKTEKIAYPRLGVNYISLDNLLDSQKSVNLKGALIYPNKNGIAIEKNSAAALVGLKAGDIITKINNTEINKDNNLSLLIAKYLPGDEILIEYTRADKTATAKAILK